MKSPTSPLCCSTLVATALLILGIAGARAQLITYDGFDTSGAYSNGNTIFQVNGGFGWSGPYGSGAANSFNSVDPGLTSGSLVTTPGAAVTPNVGSFVQNTRTFAPINSGDLWISWLYSPGAPATDYSGLGLSQAGGSSFYIGTDGDGQLRVDTSLIGGTNATYGALGTGTQFFAVNINYNTSFIGVYQNPTPGGSVGTPITSFTGTPNEVTGIVFLGNGNGVTAFDEIRIGRSYADVSPVPEPSTYALLASAGLIVALLRKRGKKA